MNAEQEQLERLERLLRVCTWLLRISSVIALVLVSWGSYSVVRWIGMPVPVAVAYPIVIDMAMLYVTPFAVNAMLPSTDEWPIRRKAARIRAFVWVVVAAFNELHAVMVIWHTVGVPAGGPVRWIAYGIASVVGVGPVVFYGYAYQIEAMVTAWVLARRSELLRAIEGKREAVQEADKEAERKTAERVAVVRAKAETAPAAPGPRPVEVPREAPRKTSAGNRTPEQWAMLEQALPGGKVGEQTAAWLIQRNAQGDPFRETPAFTRAAHILGTDPKTTRAIGQRLLAEGKLGPHLTVAGGRG